MRAKWPGMDDRGSITEVSPTSLGLTLIQNTTLYNDPECGRRPGLSSRIDLVATATLLDELFHPVAGNYAIYVTSSGTIEATAI